MSREPIQLPAEVDPLSPREHAYLWYICQGYVPREAFRLMGSGSSPSVNTRVCEKLRARRIEQAIYIACQLELIGPYLECGTQAGYRAHHGRHEEACGACRKWHTGFMERTGKVASRLEPLTDAELRLLKSFDSGRTFKQTLDKWGCSRRVLDDVRTSLYRKLDVAHLHQNTKLRAAVEEGRRRGLLRPVPPLKPAKRPRRWGTTDLTELEQRTLAAVADGTSLAEAGRTLGRNGTPIPGSSVSSRLMIVYRKLDVLHHAHGERRKAAVEEARRRGYNL